MKTAHHPIDTMPHHDTMPPAPEPPAPVVSLSDMPMVNHPHVVVSSDVLGGSPHVRGSRVPVRRLWAWHKGGASVETLIKRYPNLGPARVLDALAFAYDNTEIVKADLAIEASVMAGTQAAQNMPLLKRTP